MNAGEQLGRRHAECVRIRACIGLLAGTLLGRHVARRPDEIADLGLEVFGIVDGLGEPEIEHLRRAFARGHHVARLHVAVNDPRVVRRRERACVLASHPSFTSIGTCGSPTNARNGVPRTSSIARKNVPSTSPRSKIATAFGCVSAAAARASPSARPCAGAAYRGRSRPRPSRRARSSPGSCSARTSRQDRGARRDCIAPARRSAVSCGRGRHRVGTPPFIR